MNLLLNERQFKKWARDQAFEPFLSITRVQAKDWGQSWCSVKEQQDTWFKNNAPASYPCLAYDILVSFGYEEMRPGYLHKPEIIDYLAKMKAYEDRSR